MSERLLNMLGLMRKASSIEIGETNTGIAARSGKAKLLVVAADASDNAKSRAKGFAASKNTLSIALPFTKEEISSHVGLPGCSMAAITDIGFANAFIKGLSQEYPDRYGEAAARIEEIFIRAGQRKKEAAAHERNKRNGKRRNNV